MPKASLEFNLPEESSEFDFANKGHLYALALNDLDNILRSKIKYAPDFQDEKTTMAYDEIRQHIYELSLKYGLDI